MIKTIAIKPLAYLPGIISAIIADNDGTLCVLQPSAHEPDRVDVPVAQQEERDEGRRTEGDHVLVPEHVVVTPSKLSCA